MSLWCANFTCQLDCSYHGGIWKNDTCYKYEVLSRLCIKVDLAENEKGDRISKIEYAEGCFAGGEVAYYEPAQPNKTYALDYIPLEIRSTQDPYTIFAEQHYSMGRDLSTFMWISAGLLIAAIVLTLILGIFFCLLVKRGKSNSAHAFAKADLN